jgi:5-methylcytosine-specific restriction endonuclease McrA
MPPIKEEMAERYPAEWAAIRQAILNREGNRCKFCGAKNHEPHPKTGSRVVLTIAHVLDKRPERVALPNLAALCQKCHLKLDRGQHRLPDAPEGAWPVQSQLEAPA